MLGIVASKCQGHIALVQCCNVEILDALLKKVHCRLDAIRHLFRRLLHCCGGWRRIEVEDSISKMTSTVSGYF